MHDLQSLRRAEQSERLALAQAEEPGHMIRIAICDQHRGDRRRAPSPSAVVDTCGKRLERRSCEDLLAKVRRSVEDQPRTAVERDRQARLAARLHPPASLPGEAADRAAAVPLRNAAAGRRTENDGLQMYL